ncbi:MAG: hypothetical protein C0613_12685 [Desulfobulbaceae bacterium]|nr:MAG: hypothetical protein C0613_12685 [Desulfobulbaceae bacterium]
MRKVAQEEAVQKRTKGCAATNSPTRSLPDEKQKGGAPQNRQWSGGRGKWPPETGVLPGACSGWQISDL